MRRITTTVIKAGQPRPYADSEHIEQIKLEMYIAYGKEPGWKPYGVTKDKAVALIVALRGGGPFVMKAERQHGLDSYLDYFSPVDTEDDFNASVWEYRTVSPFTD